jgi:glutathione S-transferase
MAIEDDCLLLFYASPLLWLLERKPAKTQRSVRWTGRPWIAQADFTVADILLVTVLREIRNTDLLDL